MPAPITSLPSAPTVSKATTLKSRGHPTKKMRVVRRRGRATHTVESDDEIEREVGTDSDSDDDLSSRDSSSDSDTEPASEDVVPNGHSRIHTSRTSRSPEEGPSSGKEPPTHTNGSGSPFFNVAGNWSDMVTADETADGPATLPVIDFAEFDGHSIPTTAPRPRKTKPTRNVRPETAAPPSPPLSVNEDDGRGEIDTDRAVPSSRRSPEPLFRRPAGQTARQAYQQRLESDPSYVPTVGGFWGHDDRLLDKDLRSLSGWWRGRWQGRGRGRGFPMRGRGRGGFYGPQSASDPDPAHPDANTDDFAETPVDLQPIDRAWTHDGFEEMKRREEHRRQQHGAQPLRGLRGGRGGFIPGRGGFVRGGFASSPTRSRTGSPFLPTGRVWFAMKPELMWTKQHDGFLYFDPALKPRQGQGPGFRVKLPGRQMQVIRTSIQSHVSVDSTFKLATASVAGSDNEEKIFVVRLPKRPGKEKTTEPVTTVKESPIEDVFTVRPRLIARNPIPLPQPASALLPNDTTGPLQPVPGSIPSQEPVITVAESSEISSPPDPPVAEELTADDASDSTGWIQAEEITSQSPSIYKQTEERPIEPPVNDHRPSLPPLRTAFTPVPQPTSVYGSQYYAPAPALPPGVAMNSHGMPYELATGRPVYLQPPAVYNPRPVMHSHAGVPFVPGHIHHHSAISPDFLAQPPSHTPPMNGFVDPSTGLPIFSFPRQTSRIEIRAPTDNSEGTSSGKLSSRRPSGLRTTATAFEPSGSLGVMEPGYFPSLNTPADINLLSSFAPAESGNGEGSGSEGHQLQQPSTDLAMLSYPPYQQPYYYPEAYGYPPYMDMSQTGQYEMYPPDPRVPQGTVYY